MCSSVSRGLADSCETDKQAAAQRNRCTVMVAAAVGGCISTNLSTVRFFANSLTTKSKQTILIRGHELKPICKNYFNKLQKSNNSRSRVSWIYSVVIQNILKQTNNLSQHQVSPIRNSSKLNHGVRNATAQNNDNPFNVDGSINLSVYINSLLNCGPQPATCEYNKQR